jgi:membrane associated rhomboid family serine protease
MIEENVTHAQKFVENMPQSISKRIRPHSSLLANYIEKVDIDAPLTTTFCFVCLLVQLASTVLGRDFVTKCFGVASLSDFQFFSPLSYWTLFSQVIGHSSWDHLHGNIIHLLLVGPACEREYGTFKMLKIMILTTLSSSIAHILLGPRHSIQLGASGVVFMLILLNSLIELRLNRIPLTFICQISLWCYKEIYAHLFVNDGISHLAHLTGAVVGTIAGYMLRQEKVMEKVKDIGAKWLNKTK